MGAVLYRPLAADAPVRAFISRLTPRKRVSAKSICDQARRVQAGDMRLIDVTHMSDEVFLSFVFDRR